LRLVAANRWPVSRFSGIQAAVLRLFGISRHKNLKITEIILVVPAFRQAGPLPAQMFAGSPLVSASIFRTAKCPTFRVLKSLTGSSAEIMQKE
jgi:hypothetical protein